ncbi:fungal hydrophobin-domain-containing protein [Crassisporium funariophilum]|nr:fungal hydrophobin-domain-containing protein [Crassisporium funariophilum]
MFAQVYNLFFFLFAVLPLFVGAVALPSPQTAAPNVSQCNTGAVTCCNSLQSARTNSYAQALSLLGVITGPLTGQLGVTCSAPTVIGASGASCTNQAVCCNGNTFNGIITLGCSPVNVNV